MSPNLLASTAVLVLLAGCGKAGEHAPSGERVMAARARPERPANCRAVMPEESLTALLSAATPGQAFCLEPGPYPSPLTIRSGVTVWGPPEAVIRSTGKGTTVRLEGTAPRLLGVTVDGSGGRFDTLDAAVHLEGEGPVVEGVEVVRATFGILAEKAKGAVIRGNVVRGDAETPLGMRGDGIRLWETHDSLVERNVVTDSRDMVVWYSRRNTLRHNLVLRCRYGTHFMYSHDSSARDSVYLSNEVGVFVMYSRGIQLQRNVLANGVGAAGMGLGMKESGDLVATHNLFLHNTLGLYLDSSPVQQNEHNRFEDNVLRLHEAAVVFHGTERNNTFLRNTLRDNQAQVRVEGRTHGLETTWEGNHFDDYQGYDLDGDGVGDIPYELQSLSDELVSRNPALAFFRGAPALSLVAMAGEILPVFAPTVLIRDLKPSAKPTAELTLPPEVLGAN